MREYALCRKDNASLVRDGKNERGEWREERSKTVITRMRDSRGQAGRKEEQPALIRERLPWLHRGFLPFLLATSVTPRARPQELVSSERELARRVVTRARNTTRGSPSSHEAEPSRDEKRFRHTDRLIARRTLFSFSFFFFDLPSSSSVSPLTSILEASFFPPART